MPGGGEGSGVESIIKANLEMWIKQGIVQVYF